MTDLAARLNADERRMDWDNVRPKDAATLIILDRTGPEPRVLMGRRHMRHKFMPGKFVFPGGRVDPTDWRAPFASDYEPSVLDKLMTDMKTRPSASRARAFALASIRETYEEAGILVGIKADAAAAGPTHPDWQAFYDHGIVPALDRMRFIARAITPPRRPRRFDTRFLAVDHDAIATRLPEGGPSGELEDVAWPTLSEAKALELPTITLTILDELSMKLADGSYDDPAALVPYYSWQRKGFVRALI
ncbi:MAG: NUDIX domain-containing protein [Hyphomicrobiales bacterium]